MTITSIDHIQLAMAGDGERAARDFYEWLLGFHHVPKPPQPAVRGGCWFESGSVKLHLGVDINFSPATKAHPGFVLDDLAAIVPVLEVPVSRPTKSRRIRSTLC